MKYCTKCLIHVSGKRERCPLCGSYLSGEQTNEHFPDVSSIYYKNSLPLKILMFLSVIAAVVSLTVGYMYPSNRYLSYFITFGIACAWINIILLISKRSNIHKAMLWQGIIITALSILWDYITKWGGWSIDFVIPITGTIEIIVMAFLAFILKIDDGDYIIYLFMYAIFGIVPLIFIFTGIVNVELPSIIWAAVSVIALSSLVIFKGRDMAEELKKRLHL